MILHFVGDVQLSHYMYIYQEGHSTELQDIVKDIKKLALLS